MLSGHFLLAGDWPWPWLWSFRPCNFCSWAVGTNWTLFGSRWLTLTLTMTFQARQLILFDALIGPFLVAGDWPWPWPFRPGCYYSLACWRWFDLFWWQVTDHEVECDPRFRLFLHMTGEPQTIPHSLAAYTSVLFFQQNRRCVEEELLNIFMAHEKARLENESSTLRQVCGSCLCQSVVGLLGCSCSCWWG